MSPFMFKPLIFKPLTLIKDNPPLAYSLSGMVAVGIIWLSLTPLDELPPVPGGDKTYHLIAYSALAFPTALAKPRLILPLAMPYIALGGVIEWIQPYVNRYGEVLDFLANTAGVIIGSWAGWAFNRWIDPA
jgi:VanZ family protein